MKISDILQRQVILLVRNVRELAESGRTKPAAYEQVRKQVSAEIVNKDDMTVVTAAMSMLHGESGAQVLIDIVARCCERFYLPERVLSAVVVPVAFRMKSRMNGQVVVSDARKNDLVLLANIMASRTQASKVVFDTNLYEGMELYCTPPKVLLNFLRKLATGDDRPSGGPAPFVLRSESEPMWRVVYFLGVEVTDRSTQRSLNTDATQRQMQQWYYVAQRSVQECDAVIFNRQAVAQAKCHGVWYLNRGVQLGEELGKSYKLQSLLANFDQGIKGVQFLYTHDPISSCALLLVSSHLMSIQHRWRLSRGETLDAFRQGLDAAIDLVVPARDVLETREIDFAEYRRLATAKGLNWLLDEGISRHTYPA